jgi:hypothetical protein
VNITFAIASRQLWGGSGRHLRADVIEHGAQKIYPPPDLIFRAFADTPLDQVCLMWKHLHFMNLVSIKITTRLL